MEKQLDGKTIVPDGTYTVQGDGSICIIESGECKKGTIITVEIDGEKPKSNDSKITLEYGKVIGYSLKINEKTIIKEKICDLVKGESQKVGSKYTCYLDAERTFYVLETSENNVSLIMDSNFTDGTIPEKVAWCTDGGSNNTTCKNINITGIDAPVGKDYIGHITEVFNTEGVKVSFPSKEQITSVYSQTMPTWLYGNLAQPPSQLPYGYWTSSPYSDITDCAWRVNYYGGVGYNYVDYSDYSGLRPVITIPKSSLN